MTDEQGNRSSAATTQKSTHAFARQFTQKFAQLAEKSPVFAELQNLIDWVMLAALLQQEHIPEQIGWKQSLYLDATRLTYPTFDTPKQIPSSVSYKRTGNLVVGLVGGGVSIRAQQRLDLVKASEKTASNLDMARRSATEIQPSPTHQWWWDAPVTEKPRSRK